MSVFFRQDGTGKKEAAGTRVLVAEGIKVLATFLGDPGALRMLRLTRVHWPRIREWKVAHAL